MAAKVPISLPLLYQVALLHRNKMSQAQLINLLLLGADNQEDIDRLYNQTVPNRGIKYIDNRYPSQYFSGRSAVNGKILNIIRMESAQTLADRWTKLGYQKDEISDIAYDVYRTLQVCVREGNDRNTLLDLPISTEQEQLYFLGQFLRSAVFYNKKLNLSKEIKDTIADIRSKSKENTSFIASNAVSLPFSESKPWLIEKMEAEESAPLDKLFQLGEKIQIEYRTVKEKLDRLKPFFFQNRYVEKSQIDDIVDAFRESHGIYLVHLSGRPASIKRCVKHMDALQICDAAIFRIVLGPDSAPEEYSQIESALQINVPHEKILSPSRYSCLTTLDNWCHLYMLLFIPMTSISSVNMNTLLDSSTIETDVPQHSNDIPLDTPGFQNFIENLKPTNLIIKN